MKKQMLVIVIIVLMLAFILTGCFDNNGNKDTSDENDEGTSDGNEYTMSYSELFSDVTWDDNYQNLTLNSYEDGDIINIVDTVLFSQYNPDTSPDPLTVVAFGDEYLGLYFIGDKTAMYPPGSSVTIETKVKEYTLTEGTKSLLLESWWWIYVSGLMPNPDTNINVQFHDDEDQDRLLVIMADQTDLLWADFEIDGICDTSNLGTNVVAGDIISDCSGTITITYTPNNQLMGIWDFS